MWVFFKRFCVRNAQTLLSGKETSANSDINDINQYSDTNAEYQLRQSILTDSKVRNAMRHP